jgi:hypothetical protein
MRTHKSAAPLLRLWDVEAGTVITTEGCYLAGLELKGLDSENLPSDVLLTSAALLYDGIKSDLKEETLLQFVVVAHESYDDLWKRFDAVPRSASELLNLQRDRRLEYLRRLRSPRFSIYVFVGSLHGFTKREFEQPTVARHEEKLAGAKALTREVAAMLERADVKTRALLSREIVACPTNYTCTSNQCVCSNPTACGRSCGTTGGTCATGEVCSSSNRCEPAPSCSIDALCPAGQLCLDVQNGATDSTCSAPGAGAVGSSCNTNTVCSTLACVSKTCVQRCTSESACTNGLHCVQMPMPTPTPSNPPLTSGICILQSTCSPSCAANQFCLEPDPTGMNSTCESACTHDSDCPAQSLCVYSRVGLQLITGACAPNPLRNSATCAANEAVIADGEYVRHQAPPFQCTLLEGCSSASDCPASYPICAVVGDTSSMCGRAP